MKKFFKRGIRNWLLIIPLLLGTSSLFSGCGSFRDTRFIEENAKKILERKETLERKYRKECGIEIKKYEKKVEEPVITKNQDNTYTLFYETQFIGPSKLETILKEQIPAVTISKREEANQLIVKLPDDSQISYLEELLNKTDRMPPQVIIEIAILAEYGDMTQDFATKFNLKRNLEGESVSEPASVYYPGAAARVKGREEIGSKYGIDIDTNVITLKAILDVLESSGFVEQIFRTSITLSNNQKGVLSEEEKLPLPAYVIAGNQVVQVYSLEPVRSFLEVTPEIYDNGLVKLNLKAGVGSSKRPEGPMQFPVPVKDELSIEGVYLRVGQPFIIAGKTSELELGIRRKDPILLFLGDKDWEKRANRIWYEVTPYRITYFKEEI